MLWEKKAKSIAGEIPGDKSIFQIFGEQKRTKDDKDNIDIKDFKKTLSIKHFTYFRNNNDFDLNKDEDLTEEQLKLLKEMGV